MPQHRERKPTRLPHYDYSMPSAYFITACTKNRELLFEETEVKLAVESAWYSILDIFANLELGEFVVLPNHIHGIIWIMEEGSYRFHPGAWKSGDTCCKDGQPPISTNIRFETLSNIIGAFKTTAATRVNNLRDTLGTPVWQKSFFDRIIRNKHELECIQQYIQNNPVKWLEDRNNVLRPNFQPTSKSIDEYWHEILE